MGGQPLYIYCIANIDEEGLSFGKGGIENDAADITTVRYKNLTAVVSPGEIKQYRPTRKNNMIHEGIVEKVMMNHNVLPFRFGVVANNREEVMKMLSEKHEKFSELLEKVDNKIEMGVKITFSNINEFLAKIGENSPKIRELRQSNRDISKNQTMMIEVGKMIEKELHGISMKFKNEIFGTLSTMAANSIINENLSAEMILNASFLIEKHKEKDFDVMIYELDKKYDSKLNFKCAGPFPPYNFVKL